MYNDDIMEAARHAPVVSNATIAALERQIELSGSHAVAVDHSWRAPARKRTSHGDEPEDYIPRDVPDLENQLSDSTDDDEQHAVSVSVDPALASLVANLGDASARLQSRQRAAHTLAQDLARKETFPIEQLEACSPVGALMELAEADDTSLTLQLVLSCLTNLSSTAPKLVAQCCPAVPELLLRSLNGAETDAALRSYALIAAYNLCHEETVMAALERAGAAPVVRGLAMHCVAGGDEAKHAAELQRALKRCSSSKRPSSARPSSAANILSRVSSFSRGRGRRGAD